MTNSERGKEQKRQGAEWGLTTARRPNDERQTRKQRSAYCRLTPSNNAILASKSQLSVHAKRKSWATKQHVNNEHDNVRQKTQQTMGRPHRAHTALSLALKLWPRSSNKFSFTSSCKSYSTATSEEQMITVGTNTNECVKESSAKLSSESYENTPQKHWSSNDMAKISERNNQKIVPNSATDKLHNKQTNRQPQKETAEQQHQTNTSYDTSRRRKNETLAEIRNHDQK